LMTLGSMRPLLGQTKSRPRGFFASAQIEQSVIIWNMKSVIYKLDHYLIRRIRQASPSAARVALFIVFAWFGILKVIGTSPANPLVYELQQKTLPFLDFNTFVICFGIFEVFIGLTFLVRGWERLAIAVLSLHMVTTFLPLIFLPQVTWQGFLTPTLEGQYIIKNLLIIALAIGIAANLKPMKR